MWVCARTVPLPHRTVPRWSPRALTVRTPAPLPVPVQVNDKLFEEDAVYHHRCYVNFFNYQKNIDGTTLVPSAVTTPATEKAARQHAFLRAADALVGATGYMTIGELVAVQERVLRGGPCTTATAYAPIWMENKLKGMFGDDVCMGDGGGGGTANKRVMYAPHLTAPHPAMGQTLDCVCLVTAVPGRRSGDDHIGQKVNKNAAPLYLNLPHRYTPNAFAALERARVSGNQAAVEGRAIDAIAAALRAEIAEIEQDPDYCPDDPLTLESLYHGIPPKTRRFLHSFLGRASRHDAGGRKLKMTALGHRMIALVKSKGGYTDPLGLALATYVHGTMRSRTLIDVGSRLGLWETCDKVRPTLPLPASPGGRQPRPALRWCTAARPCPNSPCTNIRWGCASDCVCR